MAAAQEALFAAPTRRNLSLLLLPRKELQALCSVQERLDQQNAVATEEHLLVGALVRVKLGGKYVVRFVSGTSSQGGALRLAIKGLPVAVRPHEVSGSSTWATPEAYHQGGQAELEDLLGTLGPAEEALRLEQMAATAWRLKVAQRWAGRLDEYTAKYGLAALRRDMQDLAKVAEMARLLDRAPPADSHPLAQPQAPQEALPNTAVPEAAVPAAGLLPPPPQEQPVAQAQPAQEQPAAAPQQALLQLGVLVPPQDPRRLAQQAREQARAAQQRAACEGTGLQVQQQQQGQAGISQPVHSDGAAMQEGSTGTQAAEPPPHSLPSLRLPGQQEPGQTTSAGAAQGMPGMAQPCLKPLTQDGSLEKTCAAAAEQAQQAEHEAQQQHGSPGKDLSETCPWQPPVPDSSKEAQQPAPPQVPLQVMPPPEQRQPAGATSLRLGKNPPLFRPVCTQQQLPAAPMQPTPPSPPPPPQQQADRPSQGCVLPAPASLLLPSPFQLPVPPQPKPWKHHASLAAAPGRQWPGAGLTSGWGSSSGSSWQVPPPPCHLPTPGAYRGPPLPPTHLPAPGAYRGPALPPPPPPTHLPAPGAYRGPTPPLPPPPYLPMPMSWQVSKPMPPWPAIGSGCDPGSAAPEQAEAAGEPPQDPRMRPPGIRHSVTTANLCQNLMWGRCMYGLKCRRSHSTAESEGFQRWSAELVAAGLDVQQVAKRGSAIIQRAYKEDGSLDYAQMQLAEREVSYIKTDLRGLMMTEALPFRVSKLGGAIPELGRAFCQEGPLAGLTVQQLLEYMKVRGHLEEIGLDLLQKGGVAVLDYIKEAPVPAREDPSQASGGDWSDEGSPTACPAPAAARAAKGASAQRVSNSPPGRGGEGKKDESNKAGRQGKEATAGRSSISAGKCSGQRSRGVRMDRERKPSRSSSPGRSSGKRRHSSPEERRRHSSSGGKRRRSSSPVAQERLLVVGGKEVPASVRRLLIRALGARSRKGLPFQLGDLGNTMKELDSAYRPKDLPCKLVEACRALEREGLLALRWEEDQCWVAKLHR